MEFEIKFAILNMLQHNLFTTKEDTNLHLQQFLEICGTFQVKDITKSNIRIRLFPSLVGKAEQ